MTDIDSFILLFLLVVLHNIVRYLVYDVVINILV